jgi:hypothetical protein
MIVVCEPTCRGVDHERVNSGFLRTLAAAYPGLALQVYAHKSHAVSLRKTLQEEGSVPPKLEFVPIRLPVFPGGRAIAAYDRIFRRVFEAALMVGVDKVFVLSYDVDTLCAVKRLKQLDRYKHFKLSFVVHGLGEKLIVKDAVESKVNYPLVALPRRNIGRRLQRAKLHEWPQMLWRGISASVMARPVVRHALGRDRKGVRDAMEEAHSGDYRYIFLARHAARNAAIHFPAARNDVFAVTMPVKLLEPRLPARNEFAKFAAYGNVDALALHNVAKAVHDRRPHARYEIRLIGGNHFAVEGIPNVTCVGSWGHKIDRVEMEAEATDIDVFMMLFDESRYRVTCSGVLFEALSLVKPIIHFQNECVDEFNTAQTPIGIRCITFKDYIDAIIDIIENYNERQDDLARFRSGILRRREALIAENLEDAVKQSFNWDQSSRRAPGGS